MGVFSQDVFYALTNHLGEQRPLVDLSTDLIYTVYRIKVTVNTAMANYRITTQPQELVVTW